MLLLKSNADAEQYRHDEAVKQDLSTIAKRLQEAEKKIGQLVEILMEKKEEELSPDVREDQQDDSESDYGRPSGDSNPEESGSEWQREHPLSTLSCFRCVSCETL